MDSGVQCAMMDLILMLQEWYADNWDFLKMVRFILTITTVMHLSSVLLIITLIIELLAGVITNILFGEGSSVQLIHLDDFQCMGMEPNLLNCSHSPVGVHDCQHREDIGIICEQSQGKVQ